eukprot:14133572-Alexandrium_andersonii.AAC.1
MAWCPAVASAWCTLGEPGDLLEALTGRPDRLALALLRQVCFLALSADPGRPLGPLEAARWLARGVRHRGLRNA